MSEITVNLSDLPRVNATLVDGSVTDTKLGDRTIDQSLAIIDTGILGDLLGGIAHCIKSLTGNADWKTSPALTILAIQSSLNAKQATSVQLDSIASIGASPGIGALMYHGTNIAGWIGLGPNTSTTRKFLRQTGTGAAGSPPAWDVLTATDVGLPNVTNTSDANKPVSTAQQTALNLKFDKTGGTVSGATEFTTRPTYGGHGLATQSEIVTGAYLGGWNATANTPTLTNTPDTNGSFYLVTTAGSTNLNGNTTWAVGDQVRSNGSTWQRVPSLSAVASVNGRTGAVVVAFTDLAGRITIAQLPLAAVLSDINGHAAIDVPNRMLLPTTGNASDGYFRWIGPVTIVASGADNTLIQCDAGSGLDSAIQLNGPSGNTVPFSVTARGELSLINDANDPFYGNDGSKQHIIDVANLNGLSGSQRQHWANADGVTLAVTGNTTGVSDIAHGGTSGTTATGARSNLGLGDAAVANVGTTAGTVAAGDDPRITGAAQKAAANTFTGVQAINGGTVTADTPILNLTQTWNLSGAFNYRAILLNVTNTSSASSSKLIELQVGGVTKFSVDRTGIIFAAGAIPVAWLGTASNTAAAGNDTRITGAAQKASNLSDLTSVPTARTNLGLDGATIDLNTQGSHVLTIGRNHVESISSAGSAYTFSGTPLDGGPPINVNFVVTSGPLTLTVPSSRGLGDTSASTAVTFENGYHELSLAYRAGNWWRADY